MIDTPTAPPEETVQPSKSRENAVVHGFSGAGLVMPSELERQVAIRRVGFIEKYGPHDQEDFDQVELAALGMSRYLMIQPMLASRCALRCQQSAGHWPLVRALDAHERGRRLAYNPPRVVDDMKLSLGGVAWLHHEWKMLRLALETTGDWTCRQQEKAQNLSGVSRDNRHLDPHKVRGGSVEERKQLADQHLAELETLLHDDELKRRDEAERLDNIHGLGIATDPIYERLLRYEQRALRTYQKAIDYLRKRFQERNPDQPIPRDELPTARSEPDPTPIPAPTPPRDLTAEELNRLPASHFCRPPLSGKFTRAEYLARITDPANIAACPESQLPEPGGELAVAMTDWLEANGLKLDVETSLRGCVGALYTTTWAKYHGDRPMPTPFPSEIEARPASWTVATAPPNDQADRRDQARVQRDARRQEQKERREKKKAQRQARKRQR